MERPNLEGLRGFDEWCQEAEGFHPGFREELDEAVQLDQDRADGAGERLGRMLVSAARRPSAQPR